MSDIILFSIVESASHPNFKVLYERLGITEVQFSTMRKVLSKIKSQKPDLIVAEFFYGYGNNYAGINISNLDVLLFSLKKYAPEVKVIVMVEPGERQYVDKLNDILPLFSVLQHPVSDTDLYPVLTSSHEKL